MKKRFNVIKSSKSQFRFLSSHLNQWSWTPQVRNNYRPSLTQPSKLLWTTKLFSVESPQELGGSLTRATWSSPTTVHPLWTLRTTRANPQHLLPKRTHCWSNKIKYCLSKCCATVRNCLQFWRIPWLTSKATKLNCRVMSRHSKSTTRSFQCSFVRALTRMRSWSWRAERQKKEVFNR